MPEPLPDKAEPSPAPVPVLRIGGTLQGDALALATALGCTVSVLARYCNVTRSAACRWARGERDMPAGDLARVVALLPWLFVNCEVQSGATRDAARLRVLASLEGLVDVCVRSALGDARLASKIERAWGEIYAAIDSPDGRAALANITARHLLGHPAGSA